MTKAQRQEKPAEPAQDRDDPLVDRCELCTNQNVAAALKILAANDAPEPSAYAKAHREVHHLKGELMRPPGGGVSVAQEARRLPGEIAEWKDRITWRKSRGKPVPEDWPSLIVSLEARLHEKQDLLDRLPPDAQRDLGAELGALERQREECRRERERYGRSDPPEELVQRTLDVEDRIAAVGALADRRDAAQAEVHGKLTKEMAGAVHGLQTSLSNFVSVTLADRVKKIATGDAKLYSLFPARLPDEIDLIGRIAQEAAAISFALGGDGPRADAEQLLDELPAGLQAAVATRLGFPRVLVEQLRSARPSVAGAGMVEEVLGPF